MKTLLFVLYLLKGHLEVTHVDSKTGDKLYYLEHRGMTYEKITSYQVKCIIYEDKG